MKRRGVLALYLVLAAAAVAVVMLLALAASRAAGTSEAVEDARAKTSIIAATAMATVPDGLLTGDRAAVAEVDSLVRDSVLAPEVARVKVWGPDGTIIYSDEPRLIGTTYRLGSEELEVLHSGGVEAELSDLSKPENRYESNVGQMLEVYLPVKTSNGTPVLFEMYYRYDSVTDSARRIWLRFAPIVLGGLLLLALLELPLALWLVRRVRRGEEDKAALLQAAVDASEVERNRIASDLHDGVVQDLTGISYSLAAAAGTLTSEGSEMAAPVGAAADHTRTAVSALRSLLIEIYPPNLRDAGLANALDGLLASPRSRGIGVRLEINPDLTLPVEVEALLFRGAQEGLRNVVTHAHATEVKVAVAEAHGRATLTVEDNGVGVPPDAWQEPDEGHAGLRLLADLVARAGGNLTLNANSGRPGSTLTITLPSVGTS